MMLDHLGHDEAAREIEATVSRLIQENVIKSLSAGVQSTTEIGDLLASALAG